MIYVLSAGLNTTEYGGHMRYGAFLGLAAAALLLLVTLRRIRPIPGARYLMRIVPALAALGLLSFEVAALIPRHSTFEIQSPWRWLYLLTGVMILATLRLFVRWFDRPRDYAEVVLLPLGILALTALDLSYLEIDAYSDGGISWEGWVSVFLCLLLVVCGWIERYRGGLDRFQIPEEIWRVDRISAGEN